mgnify:CR=1 FL=1
MAEKVYVCVGTKKGLFLLSASKGRDKFQVAGPYLAGQIVYDAYLDTRGKPTVLAAGLSWWWGAKVFRSPNLGKTFDQTKTAPEFGKKDKDKRTLKNVWSLTPGNGKRDLWAGVEPASLFYSPDLGDSWESIRGLNDHKDHSAWNPGNGGLALHSIIPDGDRISIAISAAGHYRSDDGGKTWTAKNQGVPAGFNPEDKWPRIGQCVHKIAAHPGVPGRMYMQNHGGVDDLPDTSVLRSDDYGDTWQPIAKGLPGDFGFPVVSHPHCPDTAYVMPLEPPTRASFGGKPAVYRTENAGKSWKKLTKGLPKKDAWFTVLRDGMCADTLPKAGIYFGTTGGEVWASADDGESWKQIAEHLPPIYSVKASVVR